MQKQNKMAGHDSLQSGFWAAGRNCYSLLCVQFNSAEKQIKLCYLLMAFTATNKQYSWEGARK